MKLRLRSLESKETLKIEVPHSCSLQQLKDTVSRTISSPSSSSSLHLSLNRKDEINASSPHDSLHSIGIAGGDLIFYSFNPDSFSHETLPHKSSSPEEPDSRPTAQNSPEIAIGDSPSMPAAEKPSTLVDAEAETVDMVDGSDEAVPGKRYSEPSFVKRVLREALGDDVSDFKVLVFAVHAVVLESGFVRVDHVSGMAVSCTHLLEGWSSTSSSTISLRYTLSEILTNGASHSVNLKFQTLGHLVNVCGSLSDDAGSRLHRICLDKCKFARPFLANFKSDEGSVDDMGDDVFELWKMVKDRIALPLLIDLCEKAGLELPPCLMRLPMELKLKILESLPGVDLAKVGCTCSELWYLSSSNELWKKKFEEEFGQGMSGGKISKFMFAMYWESKKKFEKGLHSQPHRSGYIRYIPRRRPGPFGIPPIWGGEYDLQPPCFGSIPMYPPRRSFIPRCHFREFSP